jgi:hypothetical protein
VSWRARRQLIALLIIAIPLAGIGFWIVSRALPASSCVDNRQNQGELGVDCGGPCAPCELKNPKPITLFWARLVPVRTNSYDLVALVQNSNEVLSSPKVEYEFSLFDGLTPVITKKGSTFIFAQERIHVVEPNVETTRELTHVEFKITMVDWEFRQESKPSLVVEKRDYRVEEENGQKRSVLRTAVLNRSDLDLKEVVIQAVMFDQDGNALGSNHTLIDGFRAGSRREVTMPWSEVLKGEVKSIVIEARVNIFDPNIILRPQ